jgi:predicted AAA+ superfamily ATPase
MIKREIENIIANYTDAFPVIAFTGARQTGKTTLIKYLFPDYHYYNLEEISTYNHVKDDLASFVNPSVSNVIIDEVQRVPELLSQIQATVDVQKKMGSYIISGSQNLLLSERISQSLAGRAAYIELPGLVLSELDGLDGMSGADDLYGRILKGFYPAIYDRGVNPSIYYSQYISTYIERDVRLLKNITDLDAFRRFIGALAGSAGRPFNASSIADNIGVSPGAVKNWLAILEATYIVFRLRPFYRNIGKQIAKTPKIYFYDSGLLCFLLGVTSPEDLANHYMIGSIFENFVVAEIKKSIMNRNGFEKLFYYRDKRGEVDLLVNSGDAYRPIEIKKSMTYSSHFTEGLRHWSDLFSGGDMKIALPYIIYAGETNEPGSKFRLVNWKDAVSEITRDN